MLTNEDNIMGRKHLKGVVVLNCVMVAMLQDLSCVMCHVSRVVCHVSRVTCRVSCVVCHVSCVTCRVSRVVCHIPKEISQAKTTMQLNTYT